MIIREEQPADVEAVRRVNLDAFPTGAEADVVDCLRESAGECISLVAEEDGFVVGHIMFSPVTLKSAPETKFAGLGPMAVLSAYQNAGIGSALVEYGLNACASRGFVAVVVLGHPTYYPRFGFEPAADHGLQCEYPAPRDAFMVRALRPDALAGLAGVVAYHACFDGA